MSLRHVRLALALSSLAAAPAHVDAEEIRNLQVTEQHGRYNVSFEAVLDVPVNKARPLMTQPINWPLLSNIVTEAVVLAQLGDGAQKVHIRFSACVLFFCKRIRKVEEMRIEDGGDIVTVALPDESDFSYARERWHIKGDALHTHVAYEAELVPSFYVPPLIGPILLKHRLQSMLIETARNLERLAH